MGPRRTLLLRVASGGSVRLAPGSLPSRRPEATHQGGRGSTATIVPGGRAAGGGGGEAGVAESPAGPTLPSPRPPRLPIPGLSGQPVARSPSWAAPLCLPGLSPRGAALWGPMCPSLRAPCSVRPACSHRRALTPSRPLPGQPLCLGRPSRVFQLCRALCSLLAAPASSAPGLRAHPLLRPGAHLGPRRPAHPSGCPAVCGAALDLRPGERNSRASRARSGPACRCSGRAGRDTQPPGLPATSRQPRDGLFLECGASQAWHEAWAAANSLQDCSRAWGGDPVFCIATGVPSSLRLAAPPRSRLEGHGYPGSQHSPFLLNFQTLES